jgi:NAD(P)-dependent dehydrogenase (short-subunit alcohol dehydrogenase family)
MSECLALELSDDKISVNALALGAVQTEMLSQAFPGYQAPLQASDMASFVSWFLTKGDRFFNGKILPVALSTP